MENIAAQGSASQPRRLSNRAQMRQALLQQAQDAQEVRQKQRRNFWLAGLVLVTALIACLGLISVRRKPSVASTKATVRTPATMDVPSSPTTAAVPSLTAANSSYPGLAQILAMTEEELASLDIAVVNLRCAEGLLGAETIDMAATLHKIDEWTARVKQQTDLYADRFAAHPERYGSSLGKYRMDMLTTVLQQDEGIHYDPTMIILEGKEGTVDDTFFKDAHHAFLHGLTEQQVGTCSSMPVLYAAIARRLGYPVRLAQTCGHLYLQWLNEDGSHFNIEATSQGGLNDHPDEYYWQWPRRVTPEQARAFYFFQPLSARDELAAFLSMRAQVLMAAGSFANAARWQIEAENAAQHTRSEMRGVLRYFERSMPPSQVAQIDTMLQDIDEARMMARSGPSLMTSYPTPKP